MFYLLVLWRRASHKIQAHIQIMKLRLFRNIAKIRTKIGPINPAHAPYQATAYYLQISLNKMILGDIR